MKRELTSQHSFVLNQHQECRKAIHWRKKFPLFQNKTVDIPVERPAMRTNKETKQFRCSIAGLWSSLCLRALVCVGECYHAFTDSVCLITAEPWSNIANESVNTSLSLGIPHTQTKANTDVHMPVVGTMVMPVCQYTHMAISNWSSHFFFSSLVLKNSSKPVCPCWWVT